MVLTDAASWSPTVCAALVYSFPRWSPDGVPEGHLGKGQVTAIP